MRTPDKFDEFDLLKYVRFKDGTVRFCSQGEDHRTLCDESNRAQAVSAGTIAVRRKMWRIFDHGSMGLKVGSSHDDEEIIGKVLEPYGYRFRDWTRD